MLNKNGASFSLIKGLRLLLLPLSFIYGMIVMLRNKLFDTGVLESRTYSLPVISIGNLTVGGTGKTPLTEYVIRLLKDRYSLALLSRGYKRKTKGVIIAAPLSTADEIGDEPKQIQSKFPGITVAVAEKRTEGIERLLDYAKPEVIVMDDAYQHRYVKPGFSVLLIDYHRPIWKDHPFPAGNLREPASGRKRADVIVVNKCPVTLTASERDRIIQKIKPSGTQSVFFTAIEYLKPVDLDGKGQSIPPDSEVLVLAGISQPDVFIGHLSDKYKISDTVIYPDHYSFSKKDYLYIKNKLGKTEGGRRIIITTEKDMVRLKNMPWLEDDVSKRIWYIPIRLNFLFEEENKFNQLIYSYVEKNKKDS